VVFRGASTGTGEWRIDSGSAVFLGDIPMTSATQAVDPRTIDVQRIEALPGPQSTLFGSSAQSGALRIIPNRADTSGTYGSVDVSGSFMSEGDSSHKVEGVFNAALVEDKFAIRAAVFDTRTGGYIDNVLGENVFTSDTNDDVVEKDFNEWEQSGGRISALWNVSDKWDVELMYMNQSQTTQGDWR
jgi:outer membrane receptor protein involved in Fe transport